jgi:hypothetical protein
MSFSNDEGRPFAARLVRPMMRRGLRAGVLVEAAPVDGLGPEIEPALDLDAVNIEAVAGLDVGALLAFEIGVSMVSIWAGLLRDTRLLAQHRGRGSRDGANIAGSTGAPRRRFWQG